MAIKHGIKYVYCYSIRKQSSSNGVTSLAAGIFMAWIIWQAKSYASQIAGVGVEGAMQGAAAMGLVLAFSVHPVWRVAHLVWAEMPVLVHGKVCVVRKAGLVSLRE
ncbi:pilx6 protein [Salmonella enterica subsp. enterica serovar Dublin]|nr:pilx6 protein [Salmonella enterica subsp. enterica serovar Dublin]